jgi:proline racemase
VIFFHKDGYSTACGHGTIAIATWAFESGRLQAGDGVNRIFVDVPSGRVQVDVTVEAGRVRDATFINVPSFVKAVDLNVEVEGRAIPAAMSYGGAFYVSIDAADVGLAVTPENVERFIALGRSVKAILADDPAARHTDPRLSGIYGVIFFERVGTHHQRNITVFADGEVDRSPCGSGTSARLALLHHSGELGLGDVLTHDSVIGTRFLARVIDTARVDGVPAVITAVTGSAFRTGTSRFTLDPADPLGLGFQIR